MKFTIYNKKGLCEEYINVKRICYNFKTNTLVIHFKSGSELTYVHANELKFDIKDK